jgi:Fic family protein
MEMSRLSGDFEEFLAILRRRHATFMEGRPDRNPGTFKSGINRAGQTTFVAPDLVIGTLERGFEFLQGLGEAFQRAVFTMFVIAEVHPFADGNGRAARIMMNAELVAAGEERIVIPTAYRQDYLTALRALSRTSTAAPLPRMLEYAQRYTHAIDWSDFDAARSVLDRTGAFDEGEAVRLRMPVDQN